jgi:hypothetical protein
MSPEKRTPKQWAEYLGQEEQPITLLEYMAGCLGRMLSLQSSATQAAEHTEGMLGAIDQLSEQIAERSGLPYASSAKVRQALDERRDTLRRIGGKKR